MPPCPISPQLKTTAGNVTKRLECPNTALPTHFDACAVYIKMSSAHCRIKKMLIAC